MTSLGTDDRVASFAGMLISLLLLHLLDLNSLRQPQLGGSSGDAGASERLRVLRHMVCVVLADTFSCSLIYIRNS